MPQLARLTPILCLGMVIFAIEQILAQFLVGQLLIEPVNLFTHVADYAAEALVDLLHLTPATETCARIRATCGFHTTAVNATVAAVEGFRSQSNAP